MGSRVAALCLWVSGALPAQIQQPIGLSWLEPGALLVLDASGSIAQLDTRSGKFRRVVSLPPNTIPVSLASGRVSRDTLILVTVYYDFSPNRRGNLLAFRPDGSFVRQWPLPWLGVGGGMALDEKEGRAYLGGSKDGLVWSLDVVRGVSRSDVSIPAALKPRVVAALAFDSDSGRLFAADRSGRMWIRDVSGRWDEPTDTRMIYRPRGLAFYSNTLYLADESKGVLWAWDMKSRSSLWTAVPSRSVAGEPFDPVAVAVDESGIWVGSRKAGRILLFGPKGGGLRRVY
jgi:hypothetical protein